jgi:hypothetical protein
MTATPVSNPPFSSPLTDSKGLVTRAWLPVLQALFNRTGGKFDKVEAAFTAAQAAAPGTAEVVAGAGLQGGGKVAPNAAVALYCAVTSVAMLPSSANEGDWAYALNGRKTAEVAGSGTGVPVWWSNGAWVAIDSGAAVAA